MISPRDITVVFQGQLPVAGSVSESTLAGNVARLRSLLPGAPILLGTWEGVIPSAALGFDRVVLAKDPGPLPAFKKNTVHVNNVNRQLAGAAPVLGDVTTPYVLKLRLDCEVAHVGFLDWYARHGRNADGYERIAVGGFFTLDPRLFEQMPFHVSDWFAFGPTDKVRRLWSAPHMNYVDATWYDAHPYAPHSSWFDRLYLARFAIEQYVAMHYAANLGYLTPEFHNDVRPEILDSHDRFLQREMLVLDPAQYGLTSGSYRMAARSSLQYFNCLGFLDWYLLDTNANPDADVDPVLYSRARMRQRNKTWMRRASVLTDPCMPIIRQRWVKSCVSQVMRRALQLT
jgi:hypothetical protein